MTTTMFDDATIAERFNESSVEYTIRGGLHAVLQCIEAIFANYDVRGYGTAVERVYYDPLNGGQFVARMNRLASCD